MRADTPESDDEREELTALDRHRLATLVSKAAEECFPPTEVIGGSPQRDFYFRTLLRELSDNIRVHGTPLLHGSFDELYAFLSGYEHEWRKQKKYKPGRSPYRQDSMTGLVSHWTTAVAIPRAFNGHLGNVLFSFTKTGRGRKSEIILRAEITNFQTSTGRRRDIIAPSLVEIARLPRPASIHAMNEEEASKRILVERHSRRLWGTEQLAEVYAEKLSKKTLADIKKYIREFDGHLRRGDWQKAVACIVVVLMSALYYSIGYTSQWKPRVVINSANTPVLSNVKVNEWGEVAVFADDGVQATEWLDRIVNPRTGSYVTGHCDDRGCRAEWGGPCKITKDIDWKWRADSPEPQPLEVSWIPASCDSRRILVWILLDTREFLPTGQAERLPFTLQAGSGSEVVPADARWLNRDRTHLMLMWNYLLPGNGDVEVRLVYSPDLRKAGGEWVRNQRLVTPVAWIHVEQGKRPTAVEAAGNNPEAYGRPSFRYLVAENSPLPQASFLRTRTGQITGIAIIPDLTTWPPFSEIRNASYGVRIGSHWVPREELQVSSFEDQRGYYFSLSLDGETDASATVQLFGSYAAHALPASGPVPFRLRKDGSGTFLDDDRYPIVVSRDGTAVWSPELRNLPGMRRPTEKADVAALGRCQFPVLGQANP